MSRTEGSRFDTVYVFVYSRLYRTLQKAMHRFNIHRTTTCYPDGDVMDVCNWCGLRYVHPRKILSPPPSLQENDKGAQR